MQSPPQTAPEQPTQRQRPEGWSALEETAMERTAR